MFLAINGWECPVRPAPQASRKGKEFGRSHNNSLRSQVKGSQKRSWKLQTIFLPLEEADAWIGLLEGQGHVWPFNGDLYSSRGLSVNFSRASTRYLTDGTEVAVNQPGYEPGPFPGSKAVWVEEGMDNLVPLGKQKFEGWGTYQGSVVTITQNITVPEWDTDKATRLQLSDGTSLIKYHLDVLAPAVEGQDYSLSVKIKNIGQNTIQVDGNALNNYVEIAPGESKHVKISGKGNGTAFLQVRIQTVDPEDALDLVAYQPMVIEKPFLTSWHPSMRANETLTIPASVFTPVEGALLLWVYVTDMTKRGIPDQSPRVYFISGVSGAHIRLAHGTSTEWMFITKDEVGSISQITTSDLDTPNGWHLFATKWKHSEAKMLIDGVVRGIIADPCLPTTFETIYIGSQDGRINFLNTYFGPIIPLPYYPSDEQILAYYNLSRSPSPLPRLEVDGDMVGRPASNPLICEAQVDNETYFETGTRKSISFTLMEV